MMSEPKPLASLSSTLLARKGQAKPAMRPQGYAGFGVPSSFSHEDLGWNDMGTEPLAPVSAEIVPIHASRAEEPAVEAPAFVREQQDELAHQFAPASIAARAIAKAPRAAAGSKGKAAFTLRLDPDRHLQLRLVCAVEHRSAQAVVIAALDAFLKTRPAVAELAATKSTPLR